MLLRPALLVVLIALACGAADAKMRVGTNFWFLAEWAEKPFKSWAADYFETPGLTDPWDATFLEQVQRYQHLRFMDFMCTNACGLEWWKDRTRKTDIQRANPNGTPEDYKGRKVYGIAYEWIIDLCNRVQADAWICLPHRSLNSGRPDNDFARRMAILLKTGVDMKEVGLDSAGDLTTKTANDVCRGSPFGPRRGM